MPTYLDEQVSQNSGSFGSPLTPVDGASSVWDVGVNHIRCRTEFACTI
ncbi:hypothetical protein [Paenibacillus larvae]